MGASRGILRLRGEAIAHFGLYDLNCGLRKSFTWDVSKFFDPSLKLFTNCGKGVHASLSCRLLRAPEIGQIRTDLLGNWFRVKGLGV